MTPTDWLAVLAGMAAIAWVNWYFFLSKRPVAMAAAGAGGAQEITITVQGGYEPAAVKLMMKNAAVTYDPALTRPEALVAAIRDTGYEAELPRPEQTAFEEEEARDRANEEEFRTLRRKALASGAVGILAMIVSMPL